MEKNNYRDVIVKELINNPNPNSKFLRIVLYNINNEPLVVIADGYVRNNYEYEKMLEKYNKAKKTFANHSFILGMNIVTNDGDKCSLEQPNNNVMPINKELI